MDIVMIDTTNIQCKIDDEACIFSANNSISDMSKYFVTIRSEISTYYSPRKKKFFLQSK